MSSDASQVKCRWCGEVIPEGAEQCPACRRPVPADELRPLGGPQVATPNRPVGPVPWHREQPDEGPPTPAAGQEPFGSWGNVKHVIQSDRALGAVIGLLALSVVLNVLSGAVLRMAVSILVLWGVITFQWWGYWLAMIGAGVMALLLGGAFLGSQTMGHPAWWLLLPLAIYGFVLWVLYTRREHFD